MAMRERIEEALREAFSPQSLEVVNESHHHIGHPGDDGTGETHFSVRIRAPVFAPMSRIDRQRAVHRALGDLVGRIHALSLDVG